MTHPAQNTWGVPRPRDRPGRTQDPGRPARSTTSEERDSGDQRASASSSRCEPGTDPAVSLSRANRSEPIRSRSATTRSRSHLLTRATGFAASDRRSASASIRPLMRRWWRGLSPTPPAPRRTTAPGLAGSGTAQEGKLTGGSRGRENGRAEASGKESCSRGGLGGLRNMRDHNAGRTRAPAWSAKGRVRLGG